MTATKLIVSQGPGLLPDRCVSVAGIVVGIGEGLGSHPSGCFLLATGVSPSEKNLQRTGSTAILAIFIFQGSDY